MVGRVLAPVLAVGLGLSPSDYMRRAESQVIKAKTLSPKAAERRYRKYVIKVARQVGLPPRLLFAVIATESGWNTDAVSGSGAMGLMQLMPDTARHYRVRNPFDPHQNILGGARYLKYLMTLFNNNLTLAIAAYNAGQGRVLKVQGVPPIKQTQNYVRSVLEKYNDQSLVFFQ